jgi:fructose-specific phosphotransferase system IIC component
MTTKKTNHSDWKNLVQGFVGNVLEQMSENVSQKIHAWIKMLKRKTIGSILMMLGLLYLLIGLSVYFNSILGRVLPGLGYATVGILAMLIGYLISNNNSK